MKKEFSQTVTLYHVKDAAHLGTCSVLIKTSKTGEIRSRNAWGIFSADEGIGVGRVTNNDNLKTSS